MTPDNPYVDDQQQAQRHASRIRSFLIAAGSTLAAITAAMVALVFFIVT